MRSEDISKLPQPAQDYCHYLTAIRFRSPLTVLEYGSDLRTFFRWLAQKKGMCGENVPWNKIPIDVVSMEDIAAVALGEVHEFLSFCRTTLGNSPKTTTRKAVALRRFYKYLETQKGMSYNPLKNLESTSINWNKSLPKYLSLEECAQLLAAVDGANRERDLAIITLFLHCGLRLAELVGLNLSDIREDKLKVLGKGNKERILYLNKACDKAIREYLPVRAMAIKYFEELNKNEDGEVPELPLDAQKAVFLTVHMRRISRRTVQHIVYKFLEKAGLSAPGMSTHKLRHTAATLLYQHAEVDLRVLQEMLGHEQLGTTQIYTHVDSEQLREAQRRNPLNNI
ncbi:MAG: tyrosine-type recombinase/integrase [Oscillospiraceae bacterium]|nr:tyrosine-type recombinase/integrase [Oscillospiraceae bacterium]